MSRWARKGIRKQREQIIIEKHEEGLTLQKIADYIGIKSGSVHYVLKKHGLQDKLRGE